MKRRISLLLALLCLCCLCLTALAEGTESPAVVLDQTEAVVYIGRTLRLTATVSGTENNARPQMAWTSSDETVATVVNGTVTGKSAGTAEITCTVTLGDGTQISAGCTVEVQIPVTGIKPDANAISVAVGGAGEQIGYTVLPENASCRNVTWTSSDESIATVDETGLVTAVKPGRVMITIVSEADPGKKAMVNVTAIMPVSGITLDETSGIVAKGKTVKLTATVTPDDASNKGLTWTSSDPAVATVANGIVTGREIGTATIICAAADGKGAEASYEVEVFAPVAGVKADPTNANAFIGGEPLQLNVTVTPEDAKYKSVTWTSSDESIATVDDTGLVTAVKPGRVMITVTADTDPNKKATVNVTVMQPVTRITLDETDGIVAKGKTVKLTATVAPDDASNKGLTWTSSDPAVATVANGIVTGREIGIATITCAAADGSGTEASYEVEVFAPVTGLKTNIMNGTVFVGGDALQLSAEVTPADAKYKSVTWTCSDNSIATVDDTGLVSAVKAGKVTVTVICDSDPTKKASVNITVMQPVKAIALDLTSGKVAKGKTVKLTATVTPDDATDKKLNWTTSNQAVAAVSNGIVTGKGVGTAKIICEAADGSGVTAEFSVTVFQDVTGIRFEKDKMAVTCGKTLKLSATVTPGDATDKTLEWSSSAPGVASVDKETGVVTGLKDGEAVITASAVDGSGKKATVKVIVEPQIPLEALTFTRLGYFGMYNKFAVTFQNKAQTRSIQYVSIRLEYDYAGKTYSMDFYQDETIINARGSKKLGWWEVGYQLTYATNFKVYLTAVQYYDGTWDYFTQNNLVGWFI